MSVAVVKRPTTIKQTNAKNIKPHCHHGKEKETHEGFSHGYHG